MIGCTKAVYIGEQFTVYGLYNKPVCSTLPRKFRPYELLFSTEYKWRHSVFFSHNKQRLIFYLYGVLWVRYIYPSNVLFFKEVCDFWLCAIAHASSHFCCIHWFSSFKSTSTSYASSLCAPPALGNFFKHCRFESKPNSPHEAKQLSVQLNLFSFGQRLTSATHCRVRTAHSAQCAMRGAA